MSSVETGIGETEPGIGTAELLAMMPYGSGFLFIDEFLEVDRTHVVARYRFQEDAFFYRGHFSDRPITPGVILLEAMCQCGMVAHGLYLLALEKGAENVKRYRFLVTGSEVEWLEQVRPGDVVLIRAELLAWRQGRIRTRVKMLDERGAPVAESVISGMGVLWSPDNSPSGPVRQDNSEERTNTNNGGRNFL
jgi:3-hydroxyacyl-[acyl-carrier-protein] dehydratase